MGVWGWRIVINIYFAPIILIFLFIYSKLISLYRPHFLKLSFLDHFLKDPEVFPIVLFFSVSLCWSLRKAFLSLLAIVWNSAIKWVYLSFSPLFFASLLFTAICKASSDSHLTFLLSFFLGMVLLPVSCTVSWTSVHCSSALCLSDLVS